MPFDPDFYTGDRQLRYINLTRGEYGSDDDIAVDLLEDANVICSDLANGMHKPVIDVDLGVRALQSSTPGHYHLYFETEMTWENYVKLLTTMVEVGLVEPGYLGASEARGYTVARLPWVHKDEEEYEGEDPALTASEALTFEEFATTDRQLFGPARVPNDLF